MTTFDSIIPLIRTLIGDQDASHYLYTTKVLYDYIRLELLTSSDVEETDPVSSPPAFNSDLTSNQKALIIYHAAINILCPQPTTFEYKSPVMNVKRVRNNDQINEIRRVYNKLISGDFVMASDNEINKLVNDYCRFETQLTEAFTEA